jgi:large subunit ribosomal protein L24e
MRLEKCYFCSSTCYPGHGSAFVRNDGKYFRFCRSKCIRNFKMKRNPRKVRWTKAFRRAAGKEMTVDTTLEFEKRRNVPVRYDRELMTKTLQAMQRVQAIRKRRERAFYVQRIEQGQAVERAGLVKEVEKNVDLLQGKDVERANAAAFRMEEKRRVQNEKTRMKQRILATMSRNKVSVDSKDMMFD